MAARAIIRRALPAPHWERHGATGIGMANQAFASVIGRRLLPAGLEVRVMAGKATQLSVALPVALAQRHREIMFQEVGLHRSFALERNHENSQCVIEGGAGAEVEIVFARLQNPYISGLVAVHANVVG